MAITIQTLSRSSLGVSRPIVEAVDKGSPAQSAGLKAGDEIVAINGKSVRGDLIPELIWNSKGPITMTVKRDGRVVSLNSLNPTLKGGGRKFGFEMVGAASAPTAQLAEQATPLKSRLSRFLAAGGTVSGVRC